MICERAKKYSIEDLKIDGLSSAVFKALDVDLALNLRLNS